jgi:hypothetical protein
VAADSDSERLPLTSKSHAPAAGRPRPDPTATEWQTQARAWPLSGSRGSLTELNDLCGWRLRESELEPRAGRARPGPPADIRGTLVTRRRRPAWA